MTSIKSPVNPNLPGLPSLMGKVDNSKTFLLIALFYWSTPSWLKVRGGVGGGGPCDYSDSSSPLVFGFRDLRLGTELVNSNTHFRRSKVSDKSIKIFPGAKHQLFLELESTRSQVFSEIENWIERRM